MSSPFEGDILPSLLAHIRDGTNPQHQCNELSNKNLMRSLQVAMALIEADDMQSSSKADQAYTVSLLGRKWLEERPRVFTNDRVKQDVLLWQQIVSVTGQQQQQFEATEEFNTDSLGESLITELGLEDGRMHSKRGRDERSNSPESATINDAANGLLSRIARAGSGGQLRKGYVCEVYMKSSSSLDHLQPEMVEAIEALRISPTDSNKVRDEDIAGLKFAKQTITETDKAVFTAIRGIPFEISVRGYGLSQGDRIIVVDDECGLGAGVWGFSDSEAIGHPRTGGSLIDGDAMQEQHYSWSGRVQSFPGSYNLCYCSPSHSATQCDNHQHFTLPVVWAPPNVSSNLAVTAKVDVIGPYPDHRLHVVKGQPALSLTGIEGRALSGTTDNILISDACGSDAGYAVPGEHLNPLTYSGVFLGLPNNGRSVDASEDGSTFTFGSIAPISTDIGSYAICWCRISSEVSCINSGDFHAIVGRLIVNGPNERLNEDGFGYRGRQLSLVLRGQGLSTVGKDSILLRPLDNGYRDCYNGVDSEVVPFSGRLHYTLTEAMSDAEAGIFQVRGPYPNQVAVCLYGSSSCTIEALRGISSTDGDRIRVVSRRGQIGGYIPELTPHDSACPGDPERSALYGPKGEWSAISGVPASSRPAYNGGVSVSWNPTIEGDFLTSKVDEYIMCWCSAVPHSASDRPACGSLTDYGAVVGTLLIAEPLGCTEPATEGIYADTIFNIPSSLVPERGLVLLTSEVSPCGDFTLGDADDIAATIPRNRMEPVWESSNTLSFTLTDILALIEASNSFPLTKGVYKICQAPSSYDDPLVELTVQYNRLSLLGQPNLTYGSEAQMISALPHELKRFTVCPQFSTWDSSSRGCLCLPGYYTVTLAGSASVALDVAELLCEPCPLGNYCPGGRKPLRCSPGLTTSAVGAAKAEDCVCDLGRYLNQTTGMCLECPEGTYKNTVANLSTCPRGCFSPPSSSVPAVGSTSDLGARGLLDCKCLDGYILSYVGDPTAPRDPVGCIKCPVGMLCQSGLASRARVPMVLRYELDGIDDPETIGDTSDGSTTLVAERIMTVVSNLLCKDALEEDLACFIEGLSTSFPRRPIVASSTVVSTIEETFLQTIEQFEAELKSSVDDDLVVFSSLSKISPLPFSVAQNVSIQEESARLFQWFPGRDSNSLSPCPIGSLVPPGTDCMCGPGWFWIKPSPTGGPICHRCGFGFYKAETSNSVPCSPCRAISRDMVIAGLTGDVSLVGKEASARRKHVPISEVSIMGDQGPILRKYFKLRIVTGSGELVTAYARNEDIDLLSPDMCSYADSFDAPSIKVESKQLLSDSISLTVVWAVAGPGVSVGCVRLGRAVLGGPLADGSISSPWHALGYVELLGWSSYYCATSIAPCLYNWTTIGFWRYGSIRKALDGARSASELRLPVTLNTPLYSSNESESNFITNSLTVAEDTTAISSKERIREVTEVTSEARVCELCESGQMKSSVGNSNICPMACPLNSESNPGGTSPQDCYCSRGSFRDIAAEIGITAGYGQTSSIICKPCSTLVLGRPKVAECPGKELPIANADYYIVPQRVAAGSVFGAKKFEPYGITDVRSSEQFRSPVVESCIVEEDSDIPSLSPPTTCKSHGQCLEGMRGFMCAACESGYWRDDVEKSCEECHGSWWAQALYYLNVPWFLLIDSAQAVIIAKFIADAADDQSRPIHSVIIKILSNYFIAIAALEKFDFSNVKRYSRNPGMSVEVNIPTWTRSFFRHLLAVKDIVPDINIESSIMCIFDKAPDHHFVEANFWLISPLFKIVFLTVVCGALLLMRKRLWQLVLVGRQLRAKRDRTIKIVSKKVRRSLTRRRSSSSTLSTRRSSLASVMPLSPEDIEVSSDSESSQELAIKEEEQPTGGIAPRDDRLLGIWRTQYPVRVESRTRRGIRIISGFIIDCTPVYLVAVFYSWQAVTEKMLLLLQCNTFSDSVNGEHVKRLRWLSDPDIICFDGYPHSSLVLIAVTGLAIWTIGFVFVSMLLLFNKRKVLMEDHCLRKYGFLYLGFETRCWYWESVKRLQAFLYGLITNISLGDMKAKLVCYAVLSGVSCLLHVSVMPYDDRQRGLLDALEAKALFAIFITHITIQLVIMFDLADEVVVFMIILCGVINGIFIIQAIYHLLKEYALYYARKRKKQQAELEKAKEEKAMKRYHRATRKRLERFVSLGGSIDESSTQNEDTAIDNNMTHRATLQRVNEQVKPSESLVANAKKLWTRYYLPDVIVRHVERSEAMKSRIALKVDKLENSASGAEDSRSLTDEMPLLNVVLIPKTPKSALDRIAFAWLGRPWPAQEIVVTSFDRSFFWTIQCNTVDYITKCLDDSEDDAELSSVVDTGARDFAMRVLFGYAQRLRYHTNPSLWSSDITAGGPEGRRITKDLQDLSLQRDSSHSREPLSPITEENGDDEDGEVTKGMPDVRADLTLGELIVLPLISEEDALDDSKSFTADELFRAFSIVTAVNSRRIKKIYSLYCAYRSYRSLKAQGSRIEDNKTSGKGTRRGESKADKSQRSFSSNARGSASGGGNLGFGPHGGFTGGNQYQGEAESLRMENMRLNRLLQECEEEIARMNNHRLRDIEDLRLRHDMEMRTLARERDQIVEQVESYKKTSHDEVQELRKETRERQREIDQLQSEMQELVDENIDLRSKVDGDDSSRESHKKADAPLLEEEYEAKLSELEESLQDAQDEVNGLVAVTKVFLKCFLAADAISRVSRAKEALEDVLEEKNVQIIALTKFEKEVDARIREHLAERDEKISDLELENTVLKGKLTSLEESERRGGSSRAFEMLLREREIEIEALEAQLRSTQSVALTDQQKARERVNGSAGLEDVHSAVRKLQDNLQDKDDELMRLQKKVDEFARGFSAPEALKKINELENTIRQKDKHLTAARVELSEFLSEAEDIILENRYLRQAGRIPLDRLLDLNEMKIAERLSASGAIAQLRVLEQRELEWDHERVKLRKKILELSQMVAEKGVMCQGLDADKLIYLQQVANVETKLEALLNQHQTNSSPHRPHRLNLKDASSMAPGSIVTSARSTKPEIQQSIIQDEKEDVMQPPTALPRIKGLPLIAYSHVLDQAVLTPKNISQHEKAVPILYTMLLETIEENERLRNINKKLSQDLGVVGEALQSRVAAHGVLVEEHTNLLQKHAEFEKETLTRLREKEDEIRTLRPELERVKELREQSMRLQSQADSTKGDDKVKEKYLAVLERDALEGISAEYSSRELFLRDWIFHLLRLNNKAHQAVKVTMERLSASVPIHEYESIKSELIAVKERNSDIEVYLSGLQARVSESESTAEHARSRIRELLPQVTDCETREGQQQITQGDTVTGRELIVLRKQVEADEDIIKELKSQIRYVEECLATAETSLVKERSQRRQIELNGGEPASGATISSVEMERRLMAAEEAIAQTTEKSLELDQARDVLSVARRQASEARAASFKHVTELKVLREALNTICDFIRTPEEQVTHIRQIQQRLVSWVWETDKEYRIASLNDEVKRLRNEVLRLRAHNDANMEIFYSEQSQMPEPRKEAAKVEPVEEREIDSEEAEEMDELWRKIRQLESENRRLKSRAAMESLPPTSEPEDLTSVEMNDLRHGAGRIIDIMQREIKDYKARVHQLQTDNNLMRQQLIHKRAPTDTLPKKHAPFECPKRDSSTSPIPCPSLDDKNSEAMQRLQEDLSVAEKKLEVSESERQRLQAMSEAFNHRKEAISPDKQIKLLRRQVTLKSNEIERMRSVLDELKKETVRLAKHRQEQSFVSSKQAKIR
ncbi:hypothetical protein FOL47_007239 [Perkinsus chesapeaki]|uniref:Uncharacterized protein n=1 Tax=Perkinsus chesapeaki TaxID=330153 RepID=A0A7J6MW67_PERCH|nr:hypothetical protein FOL47_007239 [Perkinsus chesapeaki]